MGPKVAAFLAFVDECFAAFDREQVTLIYDAKPDAGAGTARK